MGIDFTSLARQQRHWAYIKGWGYHKTDISLRQKAYEEDVDNKSGCATATAVEAPLTCSDIKFLSSLGFRVINSSSNNVKKGQQQQQ